MKYKKLLSFLYVIIIVISSFSNVVSANVLKQSERMVASDDSFTEKVDRKILEIAHENDKIPVCIWYNDIENDIVENLVIEQLGYGIEDITENENSNIIGNVQEKTDKYIECSRKIAKKMHSNKSMDIISLAGIADKIEFISGYAPVIIANLTLDEIETLAKRSFVEFIGYYEDTSTASNDIVDSVTWEDPDINDYLDYMVPYMNDFINELTDYDINELTGLTGRNTKIGMLEPGQMSFHDTYLPSSRCQIIGNDVSTNTVHNEHATMVAYIMSSTNGMAPESQLFAKPTSKNPSSLMSDIECFLDNGVKLINMSYSMGSANTEYSFAEAYLNYITKNYNVIIVKTAGNYGAGTGDISKPGSADNIITVGSFDIRNQTLCNFSSYNDTYGCEKPDVLSSGCIYNNGTIIAQGTSFSAPVVTGTIALMLECRPSLSFYPEVVKAIVMASCHNKVAHYIEGEEQESMFDGVTEKQGAGAFDPYLALAITSNGNYGYGLIEEGETDVINFDMSPYDAIDLNVSISWLRNTNLFDGSYVDTERDDLDLYVYKDSTLVFEEDDNPNKTSSSTEMVYSLISSMTRNFDSEINYKIEIIHNADESDISTEPVRFGYAWSSDADCFSKFDEYEGLYYFKNVANNKYMTYNYDKEELGFNNFMGHYHNEYEQLFAITKQENGTYKIGSFYCPYDTGIGMSGTSVTHNSMTSDISIERTPEGYYTFIYDYEYLNSLGGLSWETKPYVSDYECWILEKVNYKLGDVDMTGSINENDYDYIIDFYDGRYIPTNSEWLLSDTNGDNKLDYSDLDLLENYIQ